MRKNCILFLTLTAIIFSSCFRVNKKDDGNYRRGWTLVWEDNFDESPDETVWSKTSRDKLPMFRYMSDSSALYSVQDGNLLLKGIANPGGDENTPFLTGGITRHAIAANEVKRIEVRARLKPVTGAIAYLSLLAKDSEENNIYIDIMERYGTDEHVYQSVSSEYTTTHGMPDNPPSSSLIGVDPNMYHIYGVEKYPDSVVFFVNGTRTKKYPRIPTDIPGQFPYDGLDFNLYMGLRMNKDADSLSFPAEMHIDWVRYYEPDQSGTPAK